VCGTKPNIKQNSKYRKENKNKKKKKTQKKKLKTKILKVLHKKKKVK